MKKKRKKYIPLPKKLVRDKIPGLHEAEHNVTVQFESARKWSLERKEALLVAKLYEEILELSIEYARGDINRCAQEIADVLDVINAIKKYVREDIDGKGFRTCGPEASSLMERAYFLIGFVSKYFSNNSFFDSYIDEYRKEKKRKKGLFTQLLVVKGETKNPKVSFF
jgi:predicted house-cleaning noncanonical NTP pyrophosphatase (MazG superfamily)